jgi:hypothetical protein
MGFLKNKYIKVLSLSFVFAALAMFFVHDKLWALPPTKAQSSAKVQELKNELASAGSVDQKKRLQGKISVINEQESQNKRDGVDDRPLHDVIASTDSDKFTQTEAHLHLPAIRTLIEKNYSGKVIPYLNMISTIIANEALYKDTHYAFYHGTTNERRLQQDFYKLLHAHKYPGVAADDFTFMRFKDEDTTKKTAQAWLIDELKENGLIDDNVAETGALLLSVNLALFGNVGFPGECTWDYFLEDKGHRLPKRDDYEAMIKSFGFSDKYIDEIMTLADVYSTKENTIIQLLVPKEKIDEIGYLAWVKGIPAHEDVIDLIKSTAKDKSFQKGIKPAMEKLTKKLEKEGEKNPIYRDMLASVKAGNFSLESYLKVYRNKPWELDNINDVTGRLLFTPDVLLNPKSGVKFYRFSTAHRDQLKEYRRRLNEIVEKMIAEKEMRKAAQPKKTIKTPRVNSSATTTRPKIR